MGACASLYSTQHLGYVKIGFVFPLLQILLNVINVIKLVLELHSENHFTIRLCYLTHLRKLNTLHHITVF